MGKTQINIDGQLNSLADDISATEKQIASLSAQLSALNTKHSDLVSENFIKTNKIKLKDVELSSGKGKPYFLNAWQFGIWLKFNSDKRWAEWNDRIFYRHDIIDGRMPYSVAKISTLKK